MNHRLVIAALTIVLTSSVEAQAGGLFNRIFCSRHSCCATSDPCRTYRTYTVCGPCYETQQRTYVGPSVDADQMRDVIREETGPGKIIDRAIDAKVNTIESAQPTDSSDLSPVNEAAPSEDQ